MSSSSPKGDSSETGPLSWLVPGIAIVVIGFMMVAGLNLALSGVSDSNHANKATPAMHLVDLRVPIADADKCVSGEGRMLPQTHTLQPVHNNGEIEYVCVPLTVTPIGTPSADTPGSQARGNLFSSL